MKTVYLDNASTTPMYPEVVDVMQKSMLEDYGNPSSTHQLGRKSKVILETARKKIAKHFLAEPGEIVFTSGATEANNYILKNSVEYLGVERIITTRIEHHAVLNMVNLLNEKGLAEVVFLNVDNKGDVDLRELEEVLQSSDKKTLVSLMMVNNEIGNLYPIKEIGEICNNANALFHSDTVQAITNYDINVSEINIDFFVASAHKFHGPKGVGFAYVKKGKDLKSIFQGGLQENGKRAGTENIHAILGMSCALDLSISKTRKKINHALFLKEYFINNLKENFKDVSFNGFSNDLEKSSPFILNVKFNKVYKMLLFQLDLKGIMASSGSACQSGAKKKSHVLTEILPPSQISSTSSVRFSFSENTCKDDLDFCVQTLKFILNTF